MAARRVGPLLALSIAMMLAGTAGAQSSQMNTGVLFLTGCWEWVAPDQIVEEHWMAPRGNTMLGVSRTVRASGELVNYEVVILRQHEDGLNYEAHPSGQDSAVFRSAPGLTGSRVVFVNPTHDFPQRIGYELKGPDSLLAWIEGTQNGKTRRVEFPYTRVSCERK